MSDYQHHIAREEVVTLAKKLIEQKSISPNDGDCQKIIAEELKEVGFTIEDFSYIDTKNIYAYHGTRNEGVCFCFAGHTDVVPPGNLDDWEFDPFTPTIKDGYLFGRGSADMKGSDAAMIVAA